MKYNSALFSVFLISLVLFFLSALSGLAQEINPKRALELYQQTLTGQRSLKDMSPAEVEHVLWAYRIMRSNSGSSNDSSECENARNRTSSAASDLAKYAKNLQKCASNNDFYNDCNSEFRRVKRAQSEYESAVSEFSYQCE